MGVLGLWWLWMSVALALGILEILLPGFVFLGFALGALAVSGLLLIGVNMLGPLALIAVFAALSLAAWLGLRRAFRGPAGKVRTFHHDIND
ncbi:MAG: hypothetical protein NXH82_10715 [Rhodobacteraceae bacterium]|nr:hypothetical protein [Paracoccaceae bacterium]